MIMTRFNGLIKTTTSLIIHGLIFLNHRLRNSNCFLSSKIHVVKNVNEFFTSKLIIKITFFTGQQGV